MNELKNPYHSVFLKKHSFSDGWLAFFVITYATCNNFITNRTCVLFRYFVIYLVVYVVQDLF